MKFYDSYGLCFFVTVEAPITSPQTPKLSIEFKAFSQPEPPDLKTLNPELFNPKPCKFSPTP